MHTKLDLWCCFYLRTLDPISRFEQLGLVVPIALCYIWSRTFFFPLKSLPIWMLWIRSSLLQVQDDLEKGVSGAVPIPSYDAGKEKVIAALVANVEAMIKSDRKITALKQLQVSKIWLRWSLFPMEHVFCVHSWPLVLQGHIWRTGYENNELEGVVFDDVPEALARWHGSGIKVIFCILKFFVIYVC